MRCCDCEFRNECEEECTVLTCFVRCEIRDEKIKQKSQIDFLKKTIAENAQKALEVTLEEIENAKREVAKEIFEEIEGSIAVHAFTSKSEDYADGMYDAIEWVDSKIADLKKKYTEG